eukprot:scaffold44152_cov79-Phaeocystis_antarctica.AAC.2
MMSVSPGAMTVMMFLRDDVLSQLGESLSGIRNVESLVDDGRSLDVERGSAAPLLARLSLAASAIEYTVNLRRPECVLPLRSLLVATSALWTLARRAFSSRVRAWAMRSKQAERFSTRIERLSLSVSLVETSWMACSVGTALPSRRAMRKSSCVSSGLSAKYETTKPLTLYSLPPSVSRSDSSKTSSRDCENSEGLQSRDTEGLLSLRGGAGYTPTSRTGSEKPTSAVSGSGRSKLMTLSSWSTP